MSIEKIYSELETDKLLHVVHRIDQAEHVPRKNLIEPSNFIQCSFLRLEKNSTFRPHKHIFKKRKYENQIAQESWVVIRGSVKCIFYDLDDSVITETVLHEGDASFTLLGGHNYVSLEDNTVVYEYKTGPYEGQEYDKNFI